MNRRTFIGGAFSLGAVSMWSGCASVGRGADFANPVIAEDWPDPAFWHVDGKYYSVATMLRKIRVSDNAIDWEDTGIDPLTPAARAKLNSVTTNLWAPCVLKIGDNWVLYISLFVDDADCRVAALTSKSPTGPFEYAAEVVNGKKLGILNAIDPYIFKDESGTVWMFFGSCQDGIHRVRLTDDGLAIRPGEKPVHVAGRRSPWDKDGKMVKIWGEPGTWEGSFLVKRGGWWYFFFSGGIFCDHTYHLMVGRSRKVDGVFVNRDGEPLTEAKAKPILMSDKGDRLYGPGHNGEIVRTDDGRDFMFFHCHDTRFPKDDRPTYLQELLWDCDGWPYFEDDKPKLRDSRFVATTLSNER